MTAPDILRVAVYQADAGRGSAAGRLDGLTAVMKDLAADPVDLLICPELFATGFGIGDAVTRAAQAPDGPFATAVARLARRHEIAIVYGYPEEAAGRPYNAALCLGKDGTRLANHRKLALPANGEREAFAMGRGLTLFDLGGWRVGILICYDVEFPETVRAAAQAGADLIAVPTALGAAWEVVARRVVPARAFENGLFVAYANYGGTDGAQAFLGESRLVGPDGRDLAVAGAEEAVIRAELDKSRIAAARQRLPYLDDCRMLEVADGRA